MSKELFVSSTPHETKVAIVEEDQLAEIYFERENEYTLAGSIYKGKVTRVLPGESRRPRRGRGRGRDKHQPANVEAAAPVEGQESAPFVISNDFDESEQPEAGEETSTEAGASEESPEPGNQAQPSSDRQQDGSRRWRGRRRRGGRRGRGFDRDEQRPAAARGAERKAFPLSRLRRGRDGRGRDRR